MANVCAKFLVDMMLNSIARYAKWLLKLTSMKFICCFLLQEILFNLNWFKVIKTYPVLSKSGTYLDHIILYVR